MEDDSVDVDDEDDDDADLESYQGETGPFNATITIKNPAAIKPIQVSTINGSILFVTFVSYLHV